MKKTPETLVLQADISRYKKNKLGANLALLGLVFSCLYFMLLYGFKVAKAPDGTDTQFRSIHIGISVIITLVLLLAAFLSSEGVKAYKRKFCIVLLVLAAFQVIRIFGIPLYGLNNDVLIVDYFGWTPATSTPLFIILVVYLIASAACFIASAVVSYIRIVNLEKHNKALADGTMDMDEFLKELDRKEETVETAEVQ